MARAAVAHPPAPAQAQAPPGDVLGELLDRMGPRVRDVLAYTAACKELFAAGAPRRRALVLARWGVCQFGGWGWAGGGSFCEPGQTARQWRAGWWRGGPPEA
jgi:hypothetical protein